MFQFPYFYFILYVPNCYSEGKKWRNIDELESEILKDLQFDRGLVRACRRLVSKYLCLNEDKELNGISLRDAILPSYPECRWGRVRYCRK